MIKITLGFEVPALDSIAKSVARFVRLYGAAHSVGKPPTPEGAFTLTRQGESEVGQIYRAVFGKLADQMAASPEAAEDLKDVANGGKLCFQLTLNGVEQPEQELDPATEVLEGIVIADGTTVVATQRWVDDAGNHSLPLTLAEFTALDTEAPPAPVGGFSLEHTGEE